MPMAITYDWLSEVIYIAGQINQLQSDESVVPSYVFTVMRGTTADFFGSHSNFETIHSFSQTSLFLSIQLTVNPLTG